MSLILLYYFRLSVFSKKLGKIAYLGLIEFEYRLDKFWTKRRGDEIRLIRAYWISIAENLPPSWGSSMKTELVYLRPKHVVCYRVFGPFHEAGPKAWDYVLDWVDRTGVREEVTTGYGLARDVPPGHILENPQGYEACIELPPSIDRSQLGAMQFQSLPGGAFVRQRYVGPFDGIIEASRNLRATYTDAHGLMADRQRPLVEIYLDNPRIVVPEKLRVDLCMPVSANMMSRVA